MVNVDEINEDIKKFDMVVKKVENLPDIYQKVEEQVEIEKNNIEAVAKIEKEQTEFCEKVEMKLQEIVTDLQKIDGEQTKFFEKTDDQNNDTNRTLYICL